MEAVVLSDLFRSIEEEYSEMMIRHHIRFHGVVSPHLPLVYGDKEQLRELFVNFIQNSMQSMPKGGPLLIRAVHEPEKEDIEISILDRGAGIPKSVLGRVFEPFFTTKSTGMGLGLAIAKKIIVEHGGQISVASEEGQGTIFTLRLPVMKSKRISIEAPDLKAAVSAG